MKISVSPSIPSGKIKAIASKSMAHRMLICAALSNNKTLIRCEETNNDIDATVLCLRALGATVTRNHPFFEITPIKQGTLNDNVILPCGESGSTLRFLLPIVCALGVNASFQMEGRLPERPLSPLKELLEANGAVISHPQKSILKVNGQLHGNTFSIDGDVSSQFISGLLFALSILPESSNLVITRSIESAPYINMTTDVLSLFGAKIEKNGNKYVINSASLTSTGKVEVEGDWSNAAFPLALGILGKGSVLVTGLNGESSQGDREIIEILRSFGGNIQESTDGYLASSSALCGIDIDASQIPDLVPIISVVAAFAQGQTKIRGASRLRLKESDRLSVTNEVLTQLGADIQEFDDGLIINGGKQLIGGTVSSHNDHRIAMSAAICAVACTESIIIDQAEAVDKSYPTFWSDLENLGVCINKTI